MMQSKDSNQNVDDIAIELIAGLITKPRMWRAGFDCEGQRLFNRECRKMNVVFGTVDNIASILLFYFLGSERVIPHFSFNSVIFLPLICECLQECAAARTRAPQNNWGESEQAQMSEI